MRILLKLLVWSLISFVILNQSSIIAIDISSLQIKKGYIEIEGTITIDPSKVPSELCYNYDSNGFLAYWEQNINEVLKQRGFGFIKVLDLQLEFLEIGNSKGFDVIGFKVKLRIQL